VQIDWASAPLHHQFRWSCAVSWSVDNDRSDLGKKRNKEEKGSYVRFSQLSRIRKLFATAPKNLGWQVSSKIIVE